MEHPFAPSIQKSLTSVALAALGLSFITGCVVEESPRPGGTVYVSPPPPPAETLVVDVPPPPPREEVIVLQPSPEHIWIRGYWEWRENRHYWVEGHWELPPQRDVVWVEPRWEHREHGYVFIKGSWSHEHREHNEQRIVQSETVVQQNTTNVNVSIIVQAPPPPRQEVILAAPSPNHVWIRGYWVWREGRHEWISGRWELPPRPGCVWEEPRWEHHDGGYAFVEGKWRNGPPVVQAHVSVETTVNVHGGFVVKSPPPPRIEPINIRIRPSPEHVWIKGYWVWRDGSHVWIAGHWEHPPHPHAVWVEPRWEHHPEGFLFIQGTWR